jgi:regulator of sirC expression with transglutaminase-like and TPR domain
LDATARFAALLALPEPEVPLDEAALLIAAHAHPALDVDARLTELDALAAHVDAASAEALARELFVGEGFSGNAADYGDPRNSLLDDVLDRRLGIPITLSVLMVEVGRRRGIPLHGVGMPGHFLVGGQPGEWFDPFHGGAELDVQDCADLFAALHPATTFAPRFLRPVGARAIVARMLANLQHTYTDRDPTAGVWVARLRLRVPGLTPGERADAAGTLGRLGQFAEAANEFDRLAGDLSGDAGTRAAAAASTLRARAN